MLSASISNAEEIAAWIEEVRGRPVELIIEKRRPVELRLGFLHPELGVIPLADKQGEVLDAVERYYREGSQRAGPWPKGGRSVRYRGGKKRS